MTKHPCTITFSIGEAHGHRRMARVMYHCGRTGVSQLMAAYPMTISGIREARAYRDEMRLVYGLIEDYDRTQSRHHSTNARLRR